MALLDKYSASVARASFMLDKPSGVSSTVNAAAAKDQANLTVVATTYANGMDIMVGGEIARISSGGGTVNLVMTKPFKYDHAVGEVVTELAEIQLGTAEAEGIKFNVAGENTDVYGVISRLVYGTLPGFSVFTGSLRMPTPTADILALALGQPRSTLIGDGTLAAQTGTVGPRSFWTDGSLFGAQQRVSLVVSVRKIDGTYMTFYAYNLSFNPTTLSVQFARGVVSNVPMSFMMSGYAIDFTDAAFVPASTVITYLASKLDMILAITAVGNLTDSGTSTTTSSGVSAPGYVIPLTSVTGVAAGVWLGIGVGAAREWHLVHSVVSLNANLRTQTQQTFQSGTPVVIQTNTPFAGISKGGVTLAVSGSVEPIEVETEVAAQGYRINNAALQFSMSLSALTPENFIATHGLPLAEYANTVLPFRKSGQGLPLTLVLTALTVGGKTVTICLWDGSAVISNETTLSQVVETKLAMAYKPRAMQMLVHA